jgi:hypothetical protein
MEEDPWEETIKLAGVFIDSVLYPLWTTKEQTIISDISRHDL